MISLVAALLLASAPAQAQDMKKPELSMKMAPLEVTTRPLSFPSGLMVILQKDDAAQFVNVATVHSGGRIHDKPGSRGAAHLAEHLTFDAMLGEGRVRDRLYAEGVDYDANTIQDWVLYRSTGPKSALPTILQVEGQRITNPLNGVTVDDLNQAKAIFQLEPYYRGVKSWNASWTKIIPALHGEGSPWNGLDPEAMLTEAASVSLDDIKAYNAAVIVPSETTIVIHGALDFDETIEMLFRSLPPAAMHPDATEEHIKTFFKPGVINPDPENPAHTTVWLEDPESGELADLSVEAINGRIDWESPDPYPVSKAYDGEVLHIPGLVETPIAVTAWALPGSWVGEDPIKQVGAQALQAAGSNASWGGRFEVAEAGCINFIALKAGHIACYARARDTRVNADELTDLLRAASSIFWDPEQTALHEIATLSGRQAALSNSLHPLENHADLTRSLAAQTALNTHWLGDPGYTARFMNDTVALESHVIRPWVQTWLPEARAVSVVVDPLPRDKWLQIAPAGSYHAALFGHSIPTAETPPTNEEVAAAYTAADLSKATRTTLDNGLEVVVMPHGSLPIASVALVSKGGTISAKGIDILAKETMRNLWHEVYEDPTGGKQELLPDRIGGQVISSQGAELTYEGWAVPKKNLDAGLYTLRRNDMARRIRPVGRTNWWKATRLALPQVWESRSTWALQERMGRIFPGHPITWTMNQTDALHLKDEVTNSQLEAYQYGKYSPKNSKLIIVGSVDPDEALKLAKQYWGSWKRDGGSPPEPLPEPAAPSGRSTLWLDAGAADHTVVAASCPLPQPTAALAAGQAVLGSVTQEAFAAALADAGVGALASVADVKQGGGVSWLDLTAVVPHDKAVDAAKAVEAVVGMSAAKGFEQDRVQQHKLRIAGSDVIKLTSTRQMVQTVAEALMLPNRGLTWYDDYGAALATVDSDALTAAAAGCAENLVVTVEAPKASFASLKEAFGAEQLDWQERSDRELETWDKGAYKRRLKERAKAGK